MIHEIRTYDIRVGTVAEYERRLVKALPFSEKYCPLGGFWRTDIGPLNQVIHIWPYDDLDQRMAARTARFTDPYWPPDVDGMVLRQASELGHPLSAMGPLKQGHLGNAYELRYYCYVPRDIKEAIERWEEILPYRQKFATLAGAWRIDVGELDKVAVMWAYDSFNQRDEQMKAASEDPKYASGTSHILVRRENKLMVPADFSPMR